MAEVLWCSFRTALLYLVFLVYWLDAQQPNFTPCLIPAHIYGEYYSIKDGQDQTTTISRNALATDQLNGQCHTFKEDFSRINVLTTEKPDVNLLLYAPDNNCYVCMKIFYQTENILQYMETNCISSSNPTLASICQDSEVTTLFRRNLVTINCKPTFEGVYHFTYEFLEGGGGICSSPKSNIVACQEPGSPYVDNQVFQMKYAYCPGISTSKDENIRYQCMGTWKEDNGDIYMAMADLGQEVWRNKFRCMLTRTDQQTPDTTQRYTMSRTAECSVLKSPYDGPVRMVLKPVPSLDQLNEIQPSCNLPQNFTGTWFTTSEYDSQVTINATHIYFKTKVDQYNVEEIYYTCKQTRDTRYLMAGITVGKCEIDYICFEFLPRHHNVVRYRIGKPFRLTNEDKLVDNYLSRKFYQSCAWQSFTIDQRYKQWTYNTFVLNPPAPIECPIAGHYLFIQKADNSANLYKTRIRGITERPRVQIDCRNFETEIAVCRKDSKRISLDVERCATVDQVGRPIGEYDIADNYLSCVGFWYENMRSLMITYDEEDAVSPFRCWVYERVGVRTIKLSRALRSACSPLQTSDSYNSSTGASLSLLLTENERQFDDCPLRYDDGHDPYKKIQDIYVIGGASAVHNSLYSIIVAIMFVFWQSLL